MKEVKAEKTESLFNSNHPLILFDGVCNLCNYSVDFIIRRDKKALFKFASLQSETGESILRENSLSTHQYDSFVLWEKGKLYRKSTAALRVCRKMTGLWPVLYGFIIIPPFIRDVVYDLIARNRYRLFGKKDTCRIPTLEERSRFIG